MSKRHDWGGFKASATLTDVGCKKCPCVMQWAAGGLGYFLNDNVTDNAPPCEPVKVINMQRYLDNELREEILKQYED